MLCPSCKKETPDGSTFCQCCEAKLPQMKRCVHCGQPLPLNSMYCSRCGGKQTTENQCMYCGKKILPNAPFCPYCGKKQVPVYHYIFTRTEFREDEFIYSINLWLAQHRSIANVKALFDTGTRVGPFVDRAVLNRVVIQYEIIQNGWNKYQYAIEDVSTINLGIPGVTLNSAEDLLNYWKSTHPWAIVTKAFGQKYARGKMSSMMLGGIMAVNKNQVYVLYKFRPEDLPKEELEQRALSEQN